MTPLTARTVCIFEDEAYTRLLPLAYARPVYDLVCGLSSLREKILRQYPKCECVLHCRDYLTEAVKVERPNVPVNEIPEGDCLWINGRVLADARFAARVPLDGQEALYVSRDDLVAARVGAGCTERIDMSNSVGPESFPIGERIEVTATMVRYPWDCIESNTEHIVQDFEESIGAGTIEGKIYEGVRVLEKGRVFVGKGARIKPNVVLDAEGGPIYVGEGATVSPNSSIEGPAVVGPETHIKAGTRISAGTTVGPACKIGGEVSRSIILSYSNKQHDGYLGHSYIGSWVNVGAGTTTSDLKNNYRPVGVYVNGELVDTESLFVGLIMGDHSKTGINTMFNTGTVVGVSCNVYGADFPPKYIPSYSWGGSGGLVEYDIEKAIQTARVVMSRRNKELTPEAEGILRHVFQTTAEKREYIK